MSLVRSFLDSLGPTTMGACATKARSSPVLPPRRSGRLSEIHALAAPRIDEPDEGVDDATALAARKDRATLLTFWLTWTTQRPWDARATAYELHWRQHVAPPMRAHLEAWLPRDLACLVVDMACGVSLDRVADVDAYPTAALAGAVRVLALAPFQGSQHVEDARNAVLVLLLPRVGARAVHQLAAWVAGRGWQDGCVDVFVVLENLCDVVDVGSTGGPHGPNGSNRRSNENAAVARVVAQLLANAYADAATQVTAGETSGDAADRRRVGRELRSQHDACLAPLQKRMPEVSPSDACWRAADDALDRLVQALLCDDCDRSSV